MKHSNKLSVKLNFHITKHRTKIYLFLISQIIESGENESSIKLYVITSLLRIINH